MITYIHSHKIWLRDTLDILQNHSNLTLKEVETILVEAILKYLDKSITHSMLFEIVAKIQTARQPLLSPDLALVLSEIDNLSNETHAPEVHKDKMYTFLENILELLNTGR